MTVRCTRSGQGFARYSDATGQPDGGTSQAHQRDIIEEASMGTNASTADHASGPTILVPVVNPASTRALLACAAALAIADGGTVEAITVVSPDIDAEHQATVERRLAEAEEIAADLGAQARARIEVSADVPTGVVTAMQRTSPSLVLIGWRGETSTADVCGRLIDRIVGRAATPVAVLRAGGAPPIEGLLPITADHLLPGGEGGLRLAIKVAMKLRASALKSLTVLATGHEPFEVPAFVREVSDEIVRDERRNHLVVAAHSSDASLIVSPVAPTAVGLRAASTHLAWSAPRANLLVTIDPGPEVMAEPQTIEVDARGKACPIPVIELAQAVATIRVGQRVRLLATDAAAKVDVPVWCRMQRQRLIEAHVADEVDEFLVERTR